ncbi:hypothetical protein [Azospirillum sp. B4]|uniref:hypothetical protein n=1 Tax=Azospirillum sp. B4 TaxID=95605 RepID=UPI0005CA9213|nr:hypothetical protein [Azospirillum sp. B4]
MGLLKKFGLAIVVVAMIGVNAVSAVEREDFHFRLYGWMATILLMVAALALIGHMLTEDWRGVLVDKRNVMSLSRLQMVIWTVLVVSAILSAGIANAVMNTANPLDLGIPEQIWAALGISGTSFIAAPMILKTQDGAVAQNGPRVPDAPPPWRWADVFQGDVNANQDKIDLSKIQQFFFTIVTVSTYAIALGFIFATADKVTFPPIDSGFITLLGISNAAYLLHKATPVNTNPLPPGAGGPPPP